MNGAVYALETRGLSREFGGFFAVNDVNFRLARNSMHAVIGPNGAGKTTAIRMLTTLIRPDEGAIEVFGRDVVRQPMATRRAIGYARKAVL